MGTTEGQDLDAYYYDVVVVGGGAAGLSGALTLGRARRSVLVVDAGEPCNATASGVHGFLTRDGMSPVAMLEAGRAEVRRYGAEVLDGRASGCSANAVRVCGQAPAVVRRLSALGTKQRRSTATYGNAEETQR